MISWFYLLSSVITRASSFQNKVHRHPHKVQNPNDLRCSPLATILIIQSESTTPSSRCLQESNGDKKLLLGRQDLRARWQRNTRGEWGRGSSAGCGRGGSQDTLSCDTGNVPRTCCTTVTSSASSIVCWV